jgi:hypothetical protein
MGIRSRRAEARAEVRAYHVEPTGSRVPTGRVYAGSGTLGPNVPDVRVTARPRIGNDWKPWHEARAIYRSGTGSTRKGSRSATRSEASPVRTPKVGVIRYGSGLESVGLLSD